MGGTNPSVPKNYVGKTFSLMCIPTQLLIEDIHFIVSKDSPEIMHKLVSKLANSNTPTSPTFSGSNGS
jgi:hypothetical protein